DLGDGGLRGVEQEWQGGVGADRRCAGAAAEVHRRRKCLRRAGRQQPDHRRSAEVAADPRLARPPHCSILLTGSSYCCPAARRPATLRSPPAIRASKSVKANAAAGGIVTAALATGPTGL